MKRSMLLCCLAAAVITSSPATSASAAPVSAAATINADASASAAKQVHYRGGWRRPGFALYLGAPSYHGPRCWWSHRLHRRVCSYY